MVIFVLENSTAPIWGVTCVSNTARINSCFI
nr:MAG TPA: hypothetical protein [Caudoviricetes sp.]